MSRRSNRLIPLIFVSWAVLSLSGPLSQAEAKKKVPLGTLTIKVKGVAKGSTVRIGVAGEKKAAKGFRKTVSRARTTTLRGLSFGLYTVKANRVTTQAGTLVPVKVKQRLLLSRKDPRGSIVVRFRAQKRPEAPADPPVREPLDLIPSSLSVGGGPEGGLACGIKRSGQAVCWSPRVARSLGASDPSRTSQGWASESTPLDFRNIEGLEDAKEISVGGGGNIPIFEGGSGGYTCAIRASGQAVCWGANWYGRLGDGTVTSSETPVNVKGLDNAIAISAGWHGACAVRQSGQTVCWGMNYGSESGSEPQVIPDIDDAVDVSAAEGSAGRTCAVRQSGQVVCWGYGSDVCYSGLDEWRSCPSPGEMVGITDAVAIESGSSHSCVLRESGEVTCWGTDGLGVLGDGVSFCETSCSHRGQRLTSVTNLDDAIAISADVADDYTCAIRQSGQLVCWGANEFGLMGETPQSFNGVALSYSAVPWDVPDMTNTESIAAGQNQACAVRKSGEVRCWYTDSAGWGFFIDL